MVSGKPIRAVLFDLSEVYLRWLKWLEFVLAERLNEDSQNISFALQNSTLSMLFKGEISEDDYFNSLLDENGWHSELDVSLMKDLIRQHFQEIAGTRQVIEKLRARWMRLGLLSVHAKEWIAYCESKFEYRILFDAVSYSFESGICKPHRDAYLEILQKLWEPSENVLFIDDSIANIEAARSLGMSVLLFENVPLLEKGLAKMWVEL